MTDLNEAMHRLINNWTLTVQVAGNPVEQTFPPLVEILRRILTPGLEGTGGGSLPNTRNPLDVNAIDLREHIQDVAGAWINEWGGTRTKDLRIDLLTFWAMLHSMHKADLIDDDTKDRLAAYPDTWAERIWDLVDPPKQVPLRGTECPKCDVAKIENMDGALSDNVQVTAREGREIAAACRNAECGHVWVGRDGLLELGRSTGSTIDFDALEELLSEGL